MINISEAIAASKRLESCKNQLNEALAASKEATGTVSNGNGDIGVTVSSKIENVNSLISEAISQIDGAAAGIRSKASEIYTKQLKEKQKQEEAARKFAEDQQKSNSQTTITGAN